jgi:hypothetical protein
VQLTRISISIVKRYYPLPKVKSLDSGHLLVQPTRISISIVNRYFPLPKVEGMVQHTLMPV